MISVEACVDTGMHVLHGGSVLSMARILPVFRMNE